MSNSITLQDAVPGSMLEAAARENISLAQTWLNCKVCALCDTSGSMNENDSRDGQARYDVMVQELKKLQRQYPGQIAVISFSNEAIWCQNGMPIFQNGGTDMAEALRFAKRVDGTGILIYLISDGEPNDETETLRVAKSFVSEIHTIFVGGQNELAAQEFLKKLAKKAGGSYQNDFTVNQLADKISKTLLLDSGQK